MTDSRDALDAIARAAEQLVPQLTERLERHGLGEIEVAHGDLRLRVTASSAAAASGKTEAPAEAHGGASGGTSPAGTERDLGSSGEATPAATAEDGDPGVRVPAPAVGFFVYADGLGPGLAVERGDALGHVEMLGVRHDVRAPRRGTVRHLIAESGEAVEYGQVVVELEAAEAVR